MTKERLQEIYDEWTGSWNRCVQLSPISEVKCKQYSADTYAVELLEAIPDIISKMKDD